MIEWFFSKILLPHPNVRVIIGYHKENKVITNKVTTGYWEIYDDKIRWMTEPGKETNSPDLWMHLPTMPDLIDPGI
jgi:hypothetical protein